MIAGDGAAFLEGELPVVAELEPGVLRTGRPVGWQRWLLTSTRTVAGSGSAPAGGGVISPAMVRTVAGSTRRTDSNTGGSVMPVSRTTARCPLEMALSQVCTVSRPMAR